MNCLLVGTAGSKFQLTLKMRSRRILRKSEVRNTLVNLFNADLNKFKMLTAILTRNSVGSRPMKSKTSERGNINKFLGAEPDKKYVMMKVCFVICLIINDVLLRRDELVKVIVDVIVKIKPYLGF